MTLEEGFDDRNGSRDVGSSVRHDFRLDTVHGQIHGIAKRDSIVRVVEQLSVDSLEDLASIEPFSRVRGSDDEEERTGKARDTDSQHSCRTRSQGAGLVTHPMSRLPLSNMSTSVPGANTRLIIAVRPFPTTARSDFSEGVGQVVSRKR